VTMRGALRQHGVDEGSELPDHLPAALRLLPRLTPEEEPRALVTEALLPALGKMRAAARGAELPYGRLLDLCEGWLRLAFDAPPGHEPARPALHLPVVEGTASPMRFFEGVNERD
jgi:nitrate reductase assembly molybdenum cofactor insertion protein NarJ